MGETCNSMCTMLKDALEAVSPRFMLHTWRRLHIHQTHPHKHLLKYKSLGVCACLDHAHICHPQNTRTYTYTYILAAVTNTAANSTMDETLAVLLVHSLEDAKGVMQTSCTQPYTRVPTTHICNPICLVSEKQRECESYS